MGTQKSCTTLWQQLADSEKVVFHGLQLAVQLRVSPLSWEWLGTTLPSLGEDGAAMATHTVPWCVGIGACHMVNSV